MALGMDDEDSFYDMVFESPDRVAVVGDNEGANKDFQFIESPIDHVSKNDHRWIESKPLSPVTPLRSTTTIFRVFTFRKSSKCQKINDYSGELRVNELIRLSKSSSKMDECARFPAKCRAEEMPVSSSFARGNAVTKYLKLIRPFYAKRQNHTTKFPDVTARHLARSQSASAAPPQAQGRDGPLMEQREEGIQGAILHCKNSYNTSSSKELLHEILGHPGRNSCEN